MYFRSVLLILGLQMSAELYKATLSYKISCQEWMQEASTAVRVADCIGKFIGALSHPWNSQIRTCRIGQHCTSVCLWEQESFPMKCFRRLKLSNCDLNCQNMPNVLVRKRDGCLSLQDLVTGLVVISCIPNIFSSPKIGIWNKTREKSLLSAKLLC